MHRFFIRSTVFNISFYILTGISCVVLLPTLFLPRRVFLGVVMGFCYTTAFLEKYILGLTYEVRGKENLPNNGAYIIAAKHQSAYETLKLHILFNDPAIVLKKELFKIPLWGWYLKKSDVIAIDRSSPKSAIKSIQDGAKHVAEQNRPIVIFPQGTRVTTETTAKEKPYKIGISRIEQATKLPIIPMALNTGLFQPRQKWCKNPGKVIFEFMPTIKISDNASYTLKQIETTIENKSNDLVKEGIKTIQTSSAFTKTLITISVTLCVIYTAFWFTAAHFTKKSITNSLSELSSDPSIAEHRFNPPIVKGFPGKIKLSVGKQTIKTVSKEQIQIDFINAQGWPLIGMPIDIQVGAIHIHSPKWPKPLSFNSLDAQISKKNEVLTIMHATLSAGKTKGYVSGTIDSGKSPHPVINLSLGIENYQPFLTELIVRKIVKAKAAMFAGVALTALEKDGLVETTLTSDKNKIYLGPLKIMELPEQD